MLTPRPQLLGQDSGMLMVPCVRPGEEAEQQVPSPGPPPAEVNGEAAAAEAEKVEQAAEERDDEDRAERDMMRNPYGLGGAEEMADGDRIDRLHALEYSAEFAAANVLDGLPLAERLEFRRNQRPLVTTSFPPQLPPFMVLDSPSWWLADTAEPSGDRSRRMTTR